MATRFQIIKKTQDGVFRTSVNTVEGVEEIIKQAEADPESVWIVVKDRQRRLRQQIWRRNEGVLVPKWWLEE
jgi:hypothetical protein